MAIITENPLGSMSGKLGDAVLKKYKKTNKQVITIKPDMSRVKPSPLQKFQRSKMKLAMDFLSPLKGLIKEAFMPFRKNTYGFDAAKSYFMKEALYPAEEGGYAIDYAKVLVTFGDLRIPEGILIDVDETSEKLNISIHWEDNTHQAVAYPDDRLLLVMNVTGRSRFIYYKNKAHRETLSATISLSRSKEPVEYQLWMAFVRPEEKRASPSVYLGTVNG